MLARQEHILLVRLSSVGDILLATPVAARLRDENPAARITWLVDAGYLDLVRGNPHIDAALAFDYTGRHQGPSGILRLARELGPVDFMVDLQHKVRTLLLSAALRPARRRALVKRRGFGICRALVGRDKILGGPHQVERYLAVLGNHQSGSVPLPVLCVDEQDRQEAGRILGGQHHQRPLVGIFPGARHPTKRWPVRHFAGLADRILRESFSVAILGGEEDGFLARSVADSMSASPSLVHTGGSLGVLAGLISLCAAVVSPDSGPAHMAAALGVPVTTIFGPTSSERWAPPGSISRVVRLELPCSPCSNHGGASCLLGTLECMQALDPELVWQATVELLEPEGR